MPRRSHPNELVVALAGALLLASCTDEPTSESPAKHDPTRFSGREWTLKTSSDVPLGPGPNHFSGDLEHLWVDDAGALHLRIAERGGRWYCAELVSKQAFGYGTYVFTLGSRGDTLAPNVVLGMFTWDDAGSAESNPWREIDFEFSRWGQPDGANFQFVVQPWDLTPGNLHRFDIDNDVSIETVHAFTWTPEFVSFASAYGSVFPPAQADLIDVWTYVGPATPTPGDARVRINLWLTWGQPPADGQPQEMIVKRFDFLP